MCGSLPAVRIPWVQPGRAGNKFCIILRQRHNARGMPKAVVFDEAFTQGAQRRRLIPLEDTI